MSDREDILQDKLDIALRALNFYAAGKHRAFGGDCIEGGAKAEKALEDIWSVGLEFEKDGNLWCAHEPDFVNLQESHAGFGSTIIEAAQNYWKAKP